MLNGRNQDCRLHTQERQDPPEDICKKLQQLRWLETDFGKPRGSDIMELYCAYWVFSNYRNLLIRDGETRGHENNELLTEAFAKSSNRKKQSFFFDAKMAFEIVNLSIVPGTIKRSNFEQRSLDDIASNEVVVLCPLWSCTSVTYSRPSQPPLRPQLPLLSFSGLLSFFHTI